MKKILFLFLISFVFLSCSNNNQTADISFSFSRNIIENQDTVTETESKLNISCKITGPSVNQVKSQKITTQKEVFFSFEEIPVDTSVIVEVNVVDTKNIRLYSGSQTLTIKQGDNPVTVNLVQIQDGANLSIDGIQGIQFEFNRTDGSEVEAPVENYFSTTDLENGIITATTTILPEENKEITNNLKYFYYLNGEKLEGNSNTITIFPTDPLEQDLNHLLVIVQYDNLSNPVYYSASLEFFVTEVQE
ncbi:MAG: hypothetical protein MR408_06960 [Spirochaetia bacterium]|nr:hypothetical protein [Spirochaetia bacterium]